MESVSEQDKSLYFGYEAAPNKIIPSRQIFVIEYPGYVKSVDKVLQTLGGEKGLKKAVNESLMELRFRPDDPFCHPINGDVIPTSNLLLKVTRRKKKRQNKNMNRGDEGNANVKEDVKFDILGIISKTCRFRGMSDYQCIPSIKHPILEYRKALESLDVDKIMGFESIINDIKEESNLPPPSFSRVECPMDYGYQQNTAVVKVLVKKNDDQFLDITLPVPEEPPPESLKNIERIPQESIDRIRKLFEERPVWTRFALENNLPPNDIRNIKRLLPLVAYLMSNGPWRDCWMRYGYDPRLNKEARFYQLLDIRSSRRPTKLGRAKRLLHVREEATTENGGTDNYNSRTSHIFDGSSTCRDVAVFQICDITYPLLKTIIESPDSVQDFCDEHDGFYKRSELTKIRKIMRRKFRALTEGKVDELMRNLQAMQGQEDFEQGDEGMFYSFEDFDNSDTFENESDYNEVEEEYDDFDV
ncbi:15083_t:CDS:10 [Funneliformis mosseae]|uniref:15083_t:CDS:1 n=1 Tax=Funneliformis mosseae TaxID=27381 RepID=A0A9N8V1H7_FUNMO|nr:15083_t:CDS:10 [Funneliformis mosseae]